MNVRAEFVEQSVLHQVGDSRRVLEQAAFERAIGASSKMALWWDAAAQSPKSVHRWRTAPADAPPWAVTKPGISNAFKVTGALEQILVSGADFDFLLDMQDRRVASISSDDAPPAPLFSFNRLTQRATGRILWPLPRYHDVDGADFLGGLDPDAVAWHDKIDKVAWRGGPGNRGAIGHPKRGRTIRLHPLLRKFKEGSFDAAQTHAVLHTMPRFRFVMNNYNDPSFDIGYTNSDGFDVLETPFINQYFKAPIPREQFQTYRYIAVIPGNDVGSSFYWTMNSGSVGLVVGCAFETFASHHFKPWEHFVPVRADQADFQRVLRWCRRHQEECRAIAARAKEMCKYLADHDLRRAVNQGVIEAVRRSFD